MIPFNIPLVKENILPTLPLDIETTVSNKIEHLFESNGKEQPSKIREQMQRLMTDKCSVFRDGAGLKQALDEIRQLKSRYMNLGLTCSGKLLTMSWKTPSNLETC
jgi:succinate dehydrogenase / fumarate reductase flavoprotein subunit